MGRRGAELNLRLAKQARSHETRVRLVEAAIQMLATHGYAATTMSKVAASAGVSPGPRQYYFPKAVDLFAAVVEKVQANTGARAAAFDGIEDAGERLTLRFRAMLDGVGSPEHMAMLELKMACRGDDTLRRAISPNIRAFEDRADEHFMSFLRDSGRSERELRALRAILAATLRGIAIAAIERDQADVIEDVRRVLPEMLLQRLGLSNAAVGSD